MTPPVLAALVVAPVGLALSLWLLGIPRTLLAAVLGALCVLPGRVLGTYDPDHIGISGGHLDLTTYGPPIVVAAAWAAWRTRRRSGVGWWAPLAGYVLAGSLLWWSGSEEMWSGTLLLLLACAAWYLGGTLGSGQLLARAGEPADEGERSDRTHRTDRTIALFATGIAGLQLLVGLAQLAGASIFALDPRTAALMGDRVNGTLDHPADLGKMLLLLALVVLPLVVSDDRLSRRLAMAFVPVSFLVVVLTGSRSNIVAFLALIGLAVVVLPSLSRRIRWGLIALAGVGAAVAAPVVLTRFAGDPGGGARFYLLQVAIEGIPRQPWLGVGPNTYVTEFGRYDQLVSEGWPVHNVPALIAAELGVVGALFFFVPLLLLVVGAVLRWNAPGAAGVHARVLLAALPALGLIGLTGWGLLNAASLPLLFLVCGVLAERTGAADALRAAYLSRPGRGLGRLAVGRAAATAVAVVVTVAVVVVATVAVVGTPQRFLEVSLPAADDTAAWNGLERGPEQTALAEELEAALESDSWPALDPSVEEAISGPVASARLSACSGGALEGTQDCAWGPRGRRVPRAMLIGSTSALTLATTMRAVHLRAGWRFWSRAADSCIFSVDTFDSGDPVLDRECQQVKKAVVRDVERVRPDVLYVANSYLPHTQADDEPFPAEEEAAGVRDYLRQLTPYVGRLVMVGAHPGGEDLSACHAPALFPSECVSEVSDYWKERAAADEQIASDFGGTWLDPRPWFCVRDLCPAFAGDVPITPGEGDLTLAYARRLMPVFAEVLSGRGLLDQHRRN